MPSRVCLAAESLTPGSGGIARAARLIARYLAQQSAAGDFDATLLSLSDTAPPTDLGLPVETFDASRPKFVVAVQRQRLGGAKMIYDFAGMARSHLPLPFFSKKYLTFMHGIEVWENATASKLKALRKADVLLSNTQYTRDRADRLHGGFGRARVCWLATETDEAPSALANVQSGRPRVLILGRLQPDRDKGHAALIECWPNVVSAVPDALLTIVGRGPHLEALKSLASASSAVNNIEFLGFLPDAQVEPLWNSSTVFAMPSMGEGFGLVYIEAMHYGLPVIGSTEDAATEINVDGQTGFNVHRDRKDELPERLIYLLKNRDRAAQMGQAAHERWREHFRFSAFARRFDPFVRELLA